MLEIMHFIENEILCLEARIEENRLKSANNGPHELTAYYRGRNDSYEHELVTLKRLYAKCANRLK